MDGLINCFKPLSLTSARTLDRVRRITSQRKSGHAGTLDPYADGVLILCMGKGTKLVESLMNLSKAYAASARLDVTSDSFDSERPLMPVPVATIPDLAQVHSVAAALVGEVQQVPPAVSALKVAGRPAYALERAASPSHSRRAVRIYELTITKYEWPALEFSVRCGRGTYVRALIRDLGAALGAGGCLTALRRTAIGPFTSTQAWTLEAMQAAQQPDYLIPLEEARTQIAAAL